MFEITDSDCFKVTLLSFLVDIEVTFLDYIKGG